MKDPPVSILAARRPARAAPQAEVEAVVHAMPLQAGGGTTALHFVAPSATKRGDPTVPEEQLPLGDPSKDWWTLDDIAAYLDVKPRSARVYRSRGQLPAEDTKFGRTPVWRPSTITNHPRPGQGARTDLPHWKAAQMNPQHTLEPTDNTDRVSVRVLLTFGDDAELVTPEHPADAPLRMPAARIAEDADLPVSELPGRRFSARRDGDGFTDFVLLDDPRA